MEMRELVLKNRDGKRMPATLTLPDRTPKGTVMLLHGLGGWKDQPLLKIVARELAEDGYLTFRFNEANSVVGPDGDFFHSTTTQSLRDVEDAIAHVRAKEGFTEPFVLLGHSMGGFAAAWYAAHHPHEVKRLILLAPAISLRSLYWAQLPWVLFWRIRGYKKMLGIDGKRFALGPEWADDFWNYDGERYAPHTTMPTLIVSAERDRTAAKTHEHRRYAKRFPQATHSTISWADHDFEGQETEVAATIKQWLTSS